MVRNYKKRNMRATHDEETFKKAFCAIEKGLSIREAAKRFNIAYCTLRERRINNSTKPTVLGRPPVFSSEIECRMAEQIQQLAKLFHGVTVSQLKRSVFSFAMEQNIPNPFNKENKVAGSDWFRGFLRRHPEISIRKPEPTSINRVTAFSPEETKIFYDLLGEIMQKYDFQPNNIYNVDESGLTTSPPPPNILATKGDKRVGGLTSQERGSLTTVVCCINATGTQFIPPMFIYGRRKKVSPQLKRNGMPGAVYHCSKNGWINEELFLEWLNHFKSYAKPTKEAPVLLILDNHTSHITIESFEFCKANNIHMLSIPPHSSHRMQPLDLTVFYALKHEFATQCTVYLAKNRLQAITPFDILEIFHKAFAECWNASKAINGFAAAGIYPYNPAIFTRKDFFVTNWEDATRRNVNLQVVTDPAIDLPSVSQPPVCPPPDISPIIDQENVNGCLNETVRSSLNATAGSSSINSSDTPLQSLFPTAGGSLDEKVTKTRQKRTRQHA